MQESKTLSRGIAFSYSGSPSTGTVITFGDNRSTQVTSAEYTALRSHFRGTEAAIGTSHNIPPQGSLGAWLQANLAGRPAIASYVAPILIEAGWAVKVNTRIIHFL